MGRLDNPAADLANWQNAGRLAKFGHWSWIADAPGDWAGGHSAYSAEGAAILGRKPADLHMGTVIYCEQIVHPADGEKLRSFCDNLNTKGDLTYTCEYRIVQPSGQVLDVLEFAENVYDSAGRIISTFGSIQDVTERKRVEKVLSETNALDLLRQVASGVAHRTNNNLAVILGNAELLRDELTSLDMVQPRQIITAAQDTAHLIDRLLSYARCQVLMPRPVSVKRLLAGVQGRIAVIAGDGIELAIVGADSARALVDPARLEMAILELVSNARDAMPSGGRIRIHAEQAMRVLDADGPESGFTVKISITDTGSGMPPATLARVFDPFFSAKQAQGLGLSMVHGFIKQSKGDIEIDSRPGVGTEVRLYLPCAVEGFEPSAIGGRMV